MALSRRLRGALRELYRQQAAVALETGQGEVASDMLVLRNVGSLELPASPLAPRLQKGVAVTAKHYARWVGGARYREPMPLESDEVPADLLARRRPRRGPRRPMPRSERERVGVGEGIRTPDPQNHNLVL